MPIGRCKCESEFQDNLYGPGNRVVNVMKDSNITKRGRCTVCGRDDAPLTGYHVETAAEAEIAKTEKKAKKEKKKDREKRK